MDERDRGEGDGGLRFDGDDLLDLGEANRGDAILILTGDASADTAMFEISMCVACVYSSATRVISGFH